MSIEGLYFLVLAPVIGPVLGLIVGIIVSIINSSDSTKSPSSCTTKSRTTSYSSSYYEPPVRDWESERILSSMESEMRAHNARVEHMMLEQESRRLTEEMYRQTHESEGSLADKFDGRLTNIFRNPWEGIL